MNDKHIKELALWLDNNTDWASEMPQIFTGEAQERLENYLKGEYK